MPSIESTFEAAVASGAIPGAAIVASSVDGSLLQPPSFLFSHWFFIANRCSIIQARIHMLGRLASAP